ncbi:hypothetical protein K402DRAFT_332569, partial [Aulographum hederae CBS 113979]
LYTSVYLYVSLHLFMSVYLYISVSTFLPTYLHRYLPTWIPTYIDTYLHTYLHRYLPTCARPASTHLHSPYCMVIARERVPSISPPYLSIFLLSRPRQ